MQDNEAGFTLEQPRQKRSAPPPKQLPMAIIVWAFCCCTLFGWKANTNRQQSQQAYSRGHYAQAEDLNEKATQWAVLGIVVGTVLTLIAAGAVAGIIYWQVTNTANL